MAVKIASPVSVRVGIRFFSIFDSFLLSPGSGPVRRRPIIEHAGSFVKNPAWNDMQNRAAIN